MDGLNTAIIARIITLNAIIEKSIFFYLIDDYYNCQYI